MKSAWCMVLAVVISSPVWALAPDGDDKKGEATKSASPVEALTAEVQAQRAELEAQRAQIEALLKAQKAAPVMSLEGAGEPPVLQEKKAEQSKSAFELSASFEGDGLFHIKSTDGNFDLHVGGRLLEEYRWIVDRPVGPTGLAAPLPTTRVAADSFYMREAFISVDGTLWKDWGFKLNGDFATDQVAKMEEGFIEWKHFKEFRLQLGQYKVPQSYEYMGSPRFLEEIQRSAFSRLNPGIEMGIMATGDVFDNMFHYWLGVSNGRGHTTNNQGRSAVDDNDNKEFQAKIAITPWLSDKESPLRKLRLGGYYNKGEQGLGAPATGPVTIGGIATNEFGTTWITLPGGEFGDQTRYGAELLYAYGPFGLRAEAQMRKDRFQNAAGTIDERLPFHGYYVTLMWMITGEEKTITARPNPAHPLDFDGGWGALELVVRYSGCSVDWGQFTTVGGSNAIGANANRVNALTAGLNWWPTKNTRISAEYIAEVYSDPLQFEASKNRRELGGVLLRFQIDY